MQKGNRADRKVYHSGTVEEIKQRWKQGRSKDLSFLKNLEKN